MSLSSIVDSRRTLVDWQHSAESGGALGLPPIQSVGRSPVQASQRVAPQNRRPPRSGPRVSDRGQSGALMKTRSTPVVHVAVRTTCIAPHPQGPRACQDLRCNRNRLRYPVRHLSQVLASGLPPGRGPGDLPELRPSPLAHSGDNPDRQLVAGLRAVAASIDPQSHHASPKVPHRPVNHLYRRRRASASGEARHDGSGLATQLATLSCTVCPSRSSCATSRRACASSIRRANQSAPRS